MTAPAVVLLLALGGCTSTEPGPPDPTGATPPGPAATAPVGPDVPRTGSPVPRTGFPGEPGVPLTAAGLAAHALRDGDLAGYRIAPLPGRTDLDPGPSGADPVCAPLAAVIEAAPGVVPGARPGQDDGTYPVATVQRTAAPDAEPGPDAGPDTAPGPGTSPGPGHGTQDPTVVTLVLAAYSGDGAGRVMAELRRALTACAAGFVTTGRGEATRYGAVTPQAAPALGDETLAYRLTGHSGTDAAPLAFRLVRVGSTVVAFRAANYLDAVVPEIPEPLVAAQTRKLTGRPPA
ncbi:hypothetical protein [uncultured Streptomyces sp.]|uniref:hypothetical protein n=1 Tax=uncultured Streptomyces sp. TaxID=174707 RepID=UPI0026065EF4|nr:hypothetical protein [uncultured Streptomyces sp.]